MSFKVIKLQSKFIKEYKSIYESHENNWHLFTFKDIVIGFFLTVTETKQKEHVTIRLL